MSSPDDTSPPAFEGEMSPSQAIIEAVAAHEGVDATDIEPPEYEPLYAVINPEALDSLFHGTTYDYDTTPDSDSELAPTGHVELEYEGYIITVYSDGRVELDEPAPADDSLGGRR